MILRYDHLAKFPSVFRSMTGFTISECERYFADFLPLFHAADQQRRQRPDRQRRPGGGPDFSLSAQDQLLAVLVWLRHYPTNEVLGYLCGVSDSTVSRVVAVSCPWWKPWACAACVCPIRRRPRAKPFPTC